MTRSFLCPLLWVAMCLLRPLCVSAVFVPVNDPQPQDHNDCPLDCQNGGSCVRQTTSSSNEEWTCDCPASFDGPVCELRRRLVDTTQCGSLTCLNGGGCVQGHLENWPDHEAPLCDCSSAWEDISDGGEVTKQRYVGKSCQTTVAPEDYCAGQRDLFCVNGGTCRNKSPNFAQRPCTCPVGFKGRHCEYADVDVPQECSLSCNDVGYCHHGSNPYSETGANGILDIDSATSKTEKYMYCSCEKGYAGTNCEFDFTRCGGYKHYCFHGSTCVDEGPNEGQCECDLTGTGALKVAGEMCEFKATDDCSDPEDPTEIHGETKKILGDELPFCVNNGVCVQDSQGYYCECDEINWTGKRCENKVEYDSAVPTPSYTTWNPTEEGSWTYWPTDGEWYSPSPSPVGGVDPERSSKNEFVIEEDDGGELSGAAKFGMVLLSFAVVFTVCLAFYRYRQRKRSFKQASVGRSSDGNLHVDMVSEETAADAGHGPDNVVDVDMNDITYNSNPIV